MYERILPNGLEVLSMRQEFSLALEHLQDLVFPTLAIEQRIRAKHFEKHVELFPEGQFVVLDGLHVVGSTTSIRLAEQTLRGTHSFSEILAGGWLTTHDPRGEWLYGIDMGVHPDYRGRGIARALYVARHVTVRQLALRGQFTVGMPSGYGAKRGEMSAEQYYEKLLRQELTDPTISAQRKIGFELHGLIPNYLDDPVCDGYGVALELPAQKDIPDRPEHYR